MSIVLCRSCQLFKYLAKLSLLHIYLKLFVVTRVGPSCVDFMSIVPFVFQVACCPQAFTEAFANWQLVRFECQFDQLSTSVSGGGVSKKINQGLIERNVRLGNNTIQFGTNNTFSVDHVISANGLS